MKANFTLFIGLLMWRYESDLLKPMIRRNVLWQELISYLEINFMYRLYFRQLKNMVWLCAVWVFDALTLCLIFYTLI